jgi:hypothetical protein
MAKDYAKTGNFEEVKIFDEITSKITKIKL